MVEIPLLDPFLTIFRSIYLKEATINVNDIKRNEVIYRTKLGTLKGKSVRGKPL